MPGQPTLAHADAATIASLRQTAKTEGRSQSEITTSSLKLYLALPETVRAALRDIEDLGTPEDHYNMVRAVARTVVSAQYDVARRWVAEEMHFDNEEFLETDEGILNEAIRVTAKGH